MKKEQLRQAEDLLKNHYEAINKLHAFKFLKVYFPEMTIKQMNKVYYNVFGN